MAQLWFLKTSCCGLWHLARDLVTLKSHWDRMRSLHVFKMWDFQQSLARVGCAIQDRRQSKQRHQCWHTANGSLSFSGQSQSPWAEGLRALSSCPCHHWLSQLLSHFPCATQSHHLLAQVMQ